MDDGATASATDCCLASCTKQPDTIAVVGGARPVEPASYSDLEVKKGEKKGHTSGGIIFIISLDAHARPSVRPFVRACSLINADVRICRNMLVHYSPAIVYFCTKAEKTGHICDIQGWSLSPFLPLFLSPLFYYEQRTPQCVKADPCAHAHMCVVDRPTAVAVSLL